MLLGYLENDKKVEIMKFRWEFMRRNKYYIEDYEKAKQLQKKAEYPPGSIVDDFDKYFDTSEYEEEKQICNKWGLSKMLDPNKKLEELLGKSDEIGESHKVQQWAKELFFWHNGVHSLDSKAIKVVNKPKNFDRNQPWFITNEGEWRNIKSSITMEIDFKKVRSLVELQKEVRRILKNDYNAFKRLKNRKHKTDYNTILRIGDMIEKEGLTHKEIIEKIYPQEDSESARIKVYQHYHRYKGLVNGDYRYLTYP